MSIPIRHNQDVSTIDPTGADCLTLNFSSAIPGSITLLPGQYDGQRVTVINLHTTLPINLVGGFNIASGGAQSYIWVASVNKWIHVIG